MQRESPRVNNAFYDELGDAWYESDAHPIALLRAENKTRNPWIQEKILSTLGPSCDILDIGCGAGFLTNCLSLDGHRVTGVDLSEKSLEIARKRDQSKRVRYMQLDAFALPFKQQSFDVICAMDFLEHVEMPGQIIHQIARLLRPRGLFFFHTFNRNTLSYLLVIKGVEWGMPDAPRNMHVYSYFIKPLELKHLCAESGMNVQEMHGLSPQFASIAFWKSVLTRRVDKGLQFQFTPSLRVGYVGVAEKSCEEE